MKTEKLPNDDSGLSKGATDDDESNITCPFCGETDYDKPGLKAHLIMGECDVYEKTKETIRLFR